MNNTDLIMMKINYFFLEYNYFTNFLNLKNAYKNNIIRNSLIVKIE